MSQHLIRPSVYLRQMAQRSRLPLTSFLETQRFHGNSTAPAPDKTATKTNDKATGKANIIKRKTPIGRLDELEEGKHPYQEKEPLPPFPDNTNPRTGEVGGPRGLEPTRYGDWERKGRVSDF